MTATPVETQPLILEHGELRFSARSLGSGPLVLLLHGFPDTPDSFRAQLPVLAAAGYRAVAVTTRGYEPASQPRDGNYSQEALASDVIAFAANLQPADPVHLVGHDWGAAVGYLAAAMAPQRFASFTAIAVPHSGRFLAEVSRYPRQLLLSRYMLFFQLPRLPEAWLRRRDFAYLRGLWRAWSPGWDLGDAAFAPLLEAFRRDGVPEAALAYYRQAFSPRQLLSPGGAPELRSVPVPTLCVTGADDGCIDSAVFEALTRAEDFPGGVRLERLEAAGHWPHRERAGAFNRLLLDWLCAAQP